MWRMSQIESSSVLGLRAVFGRLLPGHGPHSVLPTPSLAKEPYCKNPLAIERAPRRKIPWPWIVMAAIVIAMGLRPGDSAWYYDMSKNFRFAMEFSATPSHTLGISLPFTPSPWGLMGTHGIRYGPLPIWIDQIFLAFTHDLLFIASVRAMAVTAVTALSLLWLTQLLKVSPWLAVVTMFSPWLWYYNRQLWDNTLEIPLTALMFAAYAKFLQSRRAWSLCLAFICATLALLTHLMVLPFLAALAIHPLFFQTRWIMKFKWPLLLTGLLMLAISEPYLQYALTFRGIHYPDDLSKWRGWLFPLLGAQHITASHVGYFLEESWSNINPPSLRYAFTFARLVTCIAFLACWVGMIMAIPRAWKAVARRPEAATLDHLCLIGLATFLFQTVFDGIEHVSYHPHYYNATWIVYVMFAWLAFDALPRWFGAQSILARLTVPVYAASLLFVQIIIAWQIIRNGGSKGNHYNALLSNQIEVAKEISSYSDASPIDMRVDYWHDVPKTLPVICKLVGQPASNRPVRQLVVRFRDAFPGDARIVVDSYPIAFAKTDSR